MIRVILFGACGRMGTMVAEEIANQDDMILAGAIEHNEHKGLGVLLSGIEVTEDRSELPKGDIWVDFTLAEPAMHHAEMAAEKKIPLILGSTGFNKDMLTRLDQLAKNTAIMILPNGSTGIGAMKSLARKASELLGDDFDAGVHEIHHRYKKDAPSGTARMLANAIVSDKPVQTSSLRAGGIIGEHQILFASDDEEVILIHRAHSRRAFSKGLPLAIRFLHNKPPGMYGLDDLYK